MWKPLRCPLSEAHGSQGTRRDVLRGRPFDQRPALDTARNRERRPRLYELPPIHYTVVRVALQQMGIGGDDSWGAKTHPEYLLPAGKDLSFTFCFRGI